MPSWEKAGIKTSSMPWERDLPGTAQENQVPGEGKGYCPCLSSHPNGLAGELLMEKEQEQIQLRDPLLTFSWAASAPPAPLGLTCSASQAICLTSLLPPGVWLAPSVALSSARTCGRRAMMLVWIAVNHEWAVAASLQRRIRVFRLSGE